MNREVEQPRRCGAKAVPLLRASGSQPLRVRCESPAAHQGAHVHTWEGQTWVWVTGSELARRQ